MSDGQRGEEGKAGFEAQGDLNAESPTRVEIELRAAHPEAELPPQAVLAQMADALPLKPPDPHLGKVIAERYEVLSFVGRGGMSQVYKARHRELNKIVALKFLHQHLIADETNLKRFKQEAQAACCLNNPHIVGVHDFGVTENTEPFLVMDFLEGMSLAECLRKEGPLAVDRFLAIFLQVANAMSHAHEQGVIHRDLKPGNLLLAKESGEGDFVKIVDFGLAKLINPGSAEVLALTDTGEILGSPLYMSPEQALGQKADKRSDIYSLGCTMYEAIAGTAPHVGKSFYATVQKHLNEVPASIAVHRSDLKSCQFLETIILKTLAKSPDQRFQSMSEVASQLVIARETLKPKWYSRLTVLFELWKARLSAGNLRTVQLWAAAVVVVIAATLAAAFGAGWFAPAPAPVIVSTDRVWSDYDMRGQRQFNEGNYAEAESALKLATQTAYSLNEPDKMKHSLGKEALLYHVLGRTDDEKAADARIKKVAHDFPAATGVNAQESDLIERLWSMLPDQLPPEERDRLVTLSKQVSDLAQRYIDAGEFDRADKLLSAAAKRQKELLGEDHPLVASTLYDLAGLKSKEKDYKAAEGISREALSLRKRNLPAGSEDIFRSFNQLGSVLDNADKLEESEKTFKEAILLGEGVRLHNDDLLGSSYSGLGHCYLSQQRYHAAIPAFQTALGLFKKSTRHDVIASAQGGIAYAHVKLNEPEKAEAFLKDGLALRRQDLNAGDVSLSWYLRELGRLYHTTHQFDKAEPFYKEALELRQHLLPPGSDDVQKTILDLEYLYFAKRQFARAEPLGRQYLATEERGGGMETAAGALALTRLADIFYWEGKKDEAKQVYTRAVDWTLAHPDLERTHVDSGFYRLAKAFLNQGEFAKLETALKTSLDHARQKYGPASAQVAQCLDDLGHLQYEQGKLVEAEASIKSAVDIVGKSPKMDRQAAAVIINNYAHLLRVTGRHSEGDAWARIADTKRSR